MSLPKVVKDFCEGVALMVGGMISAPRETIAPESRLTQQATEALIAYSKRELGSDEAKVAIAERDGMPVYIMGWVKSPSSEHGGIAVRVNEGGYAWWCRADDLESAVENHTEWSTRFDTDNLGIAWDEDDEQMLASARESLNKVLPTAKGIAMILRQHYRPVFDTGAVKFGNEMNR